MNWLQFSDRSQMIKRESQEISFKKGRISNQPSVPYVLFVVAIVCDCDYVDWYKPRRVAPLLKLDVIERPTLYQ